MSGFVCRPMSINIPMFFCAAGRWTEVMKASHPAAIESVMLPEGSRNDQTLGVSNGLSVEAGDPRRKGVDERDRSLSSWRMVDVAVLLSEIAVDVVGSEKDFERSTAPRQSR